MTLTVSYDGVSHILSDFRRSYETPKRSFEDQPKKTRHKRQPSLLHVLDSLMELILSSMPDQPVQL